MIPRLNIGQLLGINGESVLAKDLAVGEGGIGVHTFLGSHSCGVEDVEVIEISIVKFLRVDDHIVKEPCSFVHSRNKTRAHIGSAVSRCDSSVFPTILLWDCHEFLNGDLSAGGFSCHFG